MGLTTPYHGSTAQIKIANTAIPATNWSFEGTIETADTFNMESGGFHEHVTGGKSGTGSATIKLDGAALVMDDPPNVVEGADVAIKLYIKSGGSVYINIAHATITRTRLVADTGSDVTYEIDFLVNGSWSWAGLS